MYDSSAHEGNYGHNKRTCRSCNSTWQQADFKPRVERLVTTRRPNVDDMIGRDVVATTAYGYNNAGGGRFRAQNVRGQVWSAADPTMIGARRERAYWIADGRHYYAVAESELIDSCGFEVPSMVTGGQTDTPCVEAPVMILEGVPACASCAEACAS